MKILFLCTGNSVRSQMADALTRSLAGDRLEVFSAGVMAAGIHPVTLEVLKERDLDCSQLHSKTLGEVPLEEMDYLITLCGHAKEHCPVIPEKIKQEHWPIQDPSSIVGTTEQRLQMFRETREIIRDRIVDFLKRLET